MIIRAETLQSSDDIKEVIEKHKVGFFDFGCSRGLNISHVNRKADLCGMGFDIDEKKLVEADEAGHIVSDLDILKIPNEKLVDYGHFSHVLEHLTNIDEVRAFIEESCQICKKQVLIRQPFIDNDLLLFQLGLKSGYSHWKGHKLNLTTPVLFNLLNDIRKNSPGMDFLIYYNVPITDSIYEKMFSVHADIDSINYNPETDLPKPKIRFNFPHFHQINAVIF